MLWCVKAYLDVISMHPGRALPMQVASLGTGPDLPTPVHAGVLKAYTDQVDLNL